MKQHLFYEEYVVHVCSYLNVTDRSLDKTLIWAWRGIKICHNVESVKIIKVVFQTDDIFYFVKLVHKFWRPFSEEEDVIQLIQMHLVVFLIKFYASS